MRKLLAFSLCLVQCVPLPLNGQRRDGEPRRPTLQAEWEAGALRAAENLGCKRGTWQLRGETFEQVVTVYARDYVPGDCVILLPHRGGREYFLGYAGQFEGCLCAAGPQDWTGVPVYYLTDTPRPVRL